MAQHDRPGDQHRRYNAGSFLIQFVSDQISGHRVLGISTT